MQLQLVHGQFSQHEAISLISQLIHVKIKFLESKINNLSSEEDIKMRETRIKQLQKDLFEAKKEIEHHGENISIDAQMTLID